MAIGEHEQVVAERLKAALETLEAISRDRTLLQELSADERARLLSAAGAVFDPDVVARRRAAKEMRRRKKNEKLAEDEAVLGETGIRVLRAKPVFTTPNYELPQELGEERDTLTEQHCYVCKQNYSTLHPFYDQMCKECGDFNFAKRSETADLSGRVALLTGGRVKIGYQAGIKLLRAGASLIVTTRFPNDAALRAGGRLRGVGRPPGDLRARPAAHAERRGLLPPLAELARPARLHHLERVPDGASAA